MQLAHDFLSVGGELGGHDRGRGRTFVAGVVDLKLLHFDGLAVDPGHAEAHLELGQVGDDDLLAAVDLDEGRKAAPELQRPARELQRADEDRLARGVLGEEGADPGPLLAVRVLLVGQLADRVGVGAGLPGEGTTARGEVALVAGGLDQAVHGGPDEGGVEVLVAPAGEDGALALVVGALRARVGYRVAADIGLDAAVEVRAVELAEPDRRDVEVQFRRVDVLADGHVDLQRLEVGRLGEGPPEVDHVPRELGLFVG